MLVTLSLLLFLFDYEYINRVVIVLTVYVLIKTTCRIN